MKHVKYPLLTLATLILASKIYAGTILWDFDGVTANLPSGIVDGDTVDQWRQNPGYTDLGLETLQIADGHLTQTYANLPEGQVPYNSTGGGIHGTGIQVGAFGFDWNGNGVDLNLADVATNYPYLIIKGKAGWSTNTTIGGIFYVVYEGELWFANNYRFSSITTNQDGRHVIDMRTLDVRAANRGWSGEVNAILWDVYALWFGPAIDPAGMATQWPAEFDNDPNVTKLDIDWIALSDNPNFTKPKTIKATGGDYANLKDALDNYLAGDNWGRDAGDDVLIIDGLVDSAPVNASYVRSNPALGGDNHFRSGFGAINNAGTSGTLTIRGINNAVVRHVGNARFAIRCIRGTLNIEDVIFMPDSDAHGDYVWCPIGVEPTVAAGPAFLNMTRCVVTQSNATTVTTPATTPRLDWGTNPLRNNLATGNYSYGVEIDYDDPAQSGAAINISDCTFAFTVNSCIPTNTNARAPKSGSLNVKNCLFVGLNRQAILFQNTFMSLNVDGCGFFYNGVNPNAVRNNNGPPIQLGGNNAGLSQKPVVISESIFMNNGQYTAVRCHETTVSLTLQQCTVYEDSTATGTIANSIFASGNAKVGLTLRDLIFAGPKTYNIFDVAGGVVTPTVAAGQAVLGGATLPASGAIADAFAALYSGGGPVTEDPQFASVVWDSQYDEIRGWHNGDNLLLDVSNQAYKGKGSAGPRAEAALSGGANPTYLVPVELGSFSIE